MSQRLFLKNKLDSIWGVWAEVVLCPIHTWRCTHIGTYTYTKEIYSELTSILRVLKWPYSRFQTLLRWWSSTSPFPCIPVITAFSWTGFNSTGAILSSSSVSFMPGTDSLISMLTESLWGSQSHTWRLSGLSVMTLWGWRDCSLVTQGLTQLMGAACGGGTLVQQAGLHPPSLQPQLLSCPCSIYLVNMSREPRFWMTENNSRNHQEEASGRFYSSGCKKKNVSHGYIYSWDTLRVFLVVMLGEKKKKTTHFHEINSHRDEEKPKDTKPTWPYSKLWFLGGLSTLNYHNVWGKLSSCSETLAFGRI